MTQPQQAAPGECPAIPDELENDEAKLTRHWRGYFLGALAQTSNVTAASRIAGVHPTRPYKVRSVEPDFARAWRAALLEGYEHLEMELLHRLRFGEPKEAEVKFDNTAALRLLGLHRETVARERAARENEDLSAVRASIQAKLEKLRAQVMERRARDRADG